MSNQEWTIQRSWQHWRHMSQDEEKQSKNTQHIHSVITEWCLYITHTFCDHHQIVLI